jgi:diacylglycerol kinase family enzyme
VTRILVVNPFASGVDEHRLAAVRAALPSATETVLTTAAGEATEIARNAGDVEAIYVFGGDGTFNEVLNGVERDVPLGFVPGGGTSVLPRALGLPRDPGRAAQQIANGRTRRIGLDAELVRKVDELGRRPDGRRPGDVAFMKVASGTLWASHGRFEEQLEIEGAGRAAFVLVANCSPYTYAGAVGLDLVPGASFDAGLAYVAPVSLRARDLPRLFVRGARGSGLKDGRTLSARDLDRISVRCDDPLPLQVDGEDTGDVREAVYEAERDAVTVFV